MKALLIDDERMARQELRRLLLAHPEIEVAGEARSGEEALELIRRLNPDLLFLDIRMPGMTGFELLENLESAPEVIFTTAYDKYAVKAFEVDALDYLLKPVEPARLAGAVAKLGLPRTRARSDRFFVRDGERCWLIRVEDLTLLESEGNYTRLYFGSQKPLIQRSLSALEARLDPAVFFRTGRRHLVNLKWVERVEAGPAGKVAATLRGGMTVELSRRRSARFRELLGL
jgi:two-component system LytT family response regulator